MALCCLRHEFIKKLFAFKNEIIIYNLIGLEKKLKGNQKHKILLRKLGYRCDGHATFFKLNQNLFYVLVLTRIVLPSSFFYLLMLNFVFFLCCFGQKRNEMNEFTIKKLKKFLQIRY